MINSWEIQSAIKTSLEANTIFNGEVLTLLGSPFTYDLDVNEIESIEALPVFIIHKNFALDEAGETGMYAIQFNLACMLGDTVTLGLGSYYPSIKNIEVLALQALTIADEAVCVFRLTRTSTKMFVSEIGSADDVEMIVSIGYETQSETFI